MESYSLWLFWAECWCPSKIHMVKPNLQGDGGRRGGGLRRWWGHMSTDPMNVINALIKETSKEPPQPFLHVRMQWRPRPPPRTELHQNLTIQTLSSQTSRAVGNSFLLLKPQPSISLRLPNQAKTVCPFVSASLTKHCVFKEHPRCSLCQSFTPFHGCVIFHCEHGPHILLIHFSTHPISALASPLSLSSRLSPPPHIL